MKWSLKRALFAAAALAALAAGTAGAEERLLTIVHTNDMHSHLQGFSPEGDFSPLVTGNDATIGGISRLASLIRGVRAGRANPVLAIDAGDFLMGSLFHMVSREEAVELRLLKAIGYDAVGLGNHEFDLMPDGLARILSAAYDRGGLPLVVFSSAVFDAKSSKDDSLQQAFDRGLVKRHAVIDAGGLKVGLFGVIGDEAAEVSPFASPVTFRPAAEVAKEMVTLLREQEKVDLVVCISHSGLWADPEKSEDELLAKAVPGIDIIISGHTHTRIDKPRVAGSTIIVQAWEHGKQLGVLDLAIDAGKVSLKAWKALPVDDATAGDWLVQGAVDAAIAEIDRAVLAPHGLAYRQEIVETSADMTMANDECGLGNLVADAIRWYANTAAADPADPTPVAVAFESNGIIRDDILKGSTGRIQVSDLFRVLPLGVGMDGTMAYPLIGVYLTAGEIKKALEIVTSIYPMKGSDYFLQCSGLRFAYNPNRMLFDRVTRIDLGSEEEGWTPLDYSVSNRQLYRIVANLYNATFLKIVGNYTYHVLDIVPKDREGKPIADLVAARLDADRSAPGIQELKSWVGLMEFVRTFPDPDGDGVPEVPAKYLSKLGRNLREPSWSPASLVSHASWVTWAVIGVAAVALAIVVLLVVLIVKIVRRIRRRRAA
ncbi:MAG: bifunctional UDP-sugar hydrolase/5'-nucleotidase [Spirochaetes bacterium]|nr:bifunctional UDP-sugar hydrolase/5'-nucleotidase [Spirochaetota bacterium]